MVSSLEFQQYGKKKMKLLNNWFVQDSNKNSEMP